MKYTTTTALESDGGLYRFKLWRTWGEGPAVTFVMLNPSTADGTKDDPTIRKCVGFAERNGFVRLSVVNLFAFRSTDPKGLLRSLDPYGRDNDQNILAEARASQLVVAAWGALPARPPWLRARAQRVLELLAGVADVYALATTDDGQPRHPLMLPYSAKPVLLRAKADRGGAPCNVS